MRKTLLLLSVIISSFIFVVPLYAQQKKDSVVIHQQEIVSKTNDLTNQETSTVEFLKNTWGTLNFWIVVLLLGANLIVYILNILIPIRLKNKEKQIEAYKLMISKKINYIEDIHNSMCEISDNILFGGEITVQQQRVEKLTRLTNYGGMYISQSTKDLLNQFCDSAITANMSESIRIREQFEEKYRRSQVL